MGFASDMADVATDLLTEFDERPTDSKIMLHSSNTSVWNPTLAEDVITAGAIVSLTGVASVYNSNLVDGSTIQSGDIKLTITSAVEPLAQDKIVLDDVQYSIVSITPLAYTGKDKTIAYIIQLRR